MIDHLSLIPISYFFAQIFNCFLTSCNLRRRSWSFETTSQRYQRWNVVRQRQTTGYDFDFVLDACRVKAHSRKTVLLEAFGGMLIPVLVYSWFYAASSSRGLAPFLQSQSIVSDFGMGIAWNISWIWPGRLWIHFRLVTQAALRLDSALTLTSLCGRLMKLDEVRIPVAQW